MTLLKDLQRPRGPPKVSYQSISKSLFILGKEKLNPKTYNKTNNNSQKAVQN